MLLSIQLIRISAGPHSFLFLAILRTHRHPGLQSRVFILSVEPSIYSDSPYVRLVHQTGEAPAVWAIFTIGKLTHSGRCIGQLVRGTISVLNITWWGYNLALCHASTLPTSPFKLRTQCCSANLLTLVYSKLSILAYSNLLKSICAIFGLQRMPGVAATLTTK